MRKIRFIEILPLVFVWLCMGCSSEDSQIEAPNNMGVLCLQMYSDEAYVQSETRASHTLSDFSGYTFTLNDQPITFSNGKAVIPEGSYTLTATNSASVDAGYAGPLYTGTTSFSLVAGEYKTVELNLGSPKNAMLTVVLSEDFNNLYTLSSLTLNDGKKGYTLESTEQAAYFPAKATTLNYTLVADAKAGSHVEDITGATGTVGITAGTHTTLTLYVNPITGYITIESGGSHSGEFQ